MSTHQPPPIYELGPEFYDEVQPASFPKAQLRYRNQAAAESIGLGHLTESEWKSYFADFKPMPGNLVTALALRYHGHQFRSYNPQIGDGRGFLYAQFLVQEKLYDLGTKGSGRTPYSRTGDGRLTLKGAFREILATELLEAYGVNTSKTFSVFETAEELERHDEPSPTRAGVLVRLNHSHIRYGTFQRLAFLKETENIVKLVDYCCRHYYPELLQYQGEERAAAFLQAVCRNAARTTAEWMLAGFVHGVLNTDNMNITGESFDYGPYRFMPQYDPAFTAAYFDQSGLYAYGRQPTSVLWNLHQLGFALKVGYPNLPYEELLEEFADDFNFESRRIFMHRLNIKNPLQDERASLEMDQEMMMNFFKFLSEAQPLFEQTFFDLHSGVNEDRLRDSVQSATYSHPSFADLKKNLEFYEVLNEEKTAHPYFKNNKCCSLIIDELESIWAPIAENDDWTLFDKKLQDIRAIKGIY
ncbi:protein adenylyltransferase SelO family protein [Bdellovibrio sp. KM01]|uniref:protein adenylyltransferase SelO family protein n=1 Tax=Bdellovibrio sp. KM01 TaxID=2748865 RepID=UPI0015E9DB61|nr:YdiU family protein [Bdellovibrio sp. KM01]QLY23942.1 YdiU family protein [Bdellovibrio sp. KM01]